MRIDRLLDTYLGNMITQAEYQAKREALLNEKIELEEKIAQVERSATGWLEPCKAFLEAAHGARKLLEEENLEAQKDFCQKIGSNHRLAAKALVFDFNSPWLHLAAADAAAPGGGILDPTKKIGSNYRLARASLQFSYNLPWAHLADGVNLQNLRRGGDLPSGSRLRVLPRRPA